MPQVLRSLVVTAVAASLIAVSPPAGAHHRPNVHCSESGDICQSVRKIDGVRKLRIVLAARYFSTYHLCVRDADGYRICAPFRIRGRADGLYGSSVRWRRHFPPGGPGPYTASWWVGDDRIGRSLGFHIR